MRYCPPLLTQVYKSALVHHERETLIHGAYESSCYRLRKKTTANSGKHSVLMVNDSDIVPRGLRASPGFRNLPCALERDA